MSTDMWPISAGDGTASWTLVLAAGDGSRLSQLTRAASGHSVPKQFCSLHDGPSLLHEALARAERVVTPERSCVVVAEQHRCWWKPSLRHLPTANVIIQPRNCGTALGLLLGLLCIVERDPAATVAILPSDHHVAREEVLTEALQTALGQLRWRFAETLLLGLIPEESDPELGYILPGDADGQGARRVQEFIEKPMPSAARELIGRGALWNAFIVVASAAALLSLFQRRISRLVLEMRSALQGDRAHPGGQALQQLYARLPSLDFSRDILQGQEERLRVLPVAPCGWSDLGTPGRVANALRRASPPSAQRPGAVRHRSTPHPVVLSLAAQFETLGQPLG